MIIKRRHRLVAVACVAGLVLGACGRDDKDASTTTAPTTAAPSTEAPQTTDGAPSSTEGGTESTDAPASTDAPSAEPGPGDFATLKDVCGPGDASGATDQGVTDTEITMGTISDPGNSASPGLNQELFDAATAFVGWCNDAGGVNGRKIKLNLHDAKLFEVGAAVTEACQTDFMLVGDGMALDSAAAEPRVDCGLPQIAAFTVSRVAGRAEGSIEALVNNDSAARTEPFLKQLLEDQPDLKDHFAVWNLDLPSVIPTGIRTTNAAKAMGWNIQVYETIPSGVDNWRPYIEKIKEKDIKVIYYLGNPISLTSALKAMSDVGYFPEYIFNEASFYDQSLIVNANENLGKTKVLVNGTIWPFELRDENPATDQYLDILAKYAPNAQPKALGVNAFSAWLLWASSARDCGSELTRDCVMDTAVTFTDWDGGGLHGKNTPAPTSGETSECSTLLLATPDGFEIYDELAKPNDRIWNCTPGKFGEWSEDL